MSKYLMLSAAVLLAGSAAAQAGQPSARNSRDFVFGTSGGGSYCDGGTGEWSGILYTWVHTNADCAGANYLGGPGIEGKTRGIGSNVNMFDSASYSNSMVCSFDFPAKFKIGGTWLLYCDTDGSLVELGSGILKSPDPNRPNGNGKSLASLVRAMIAERRAKKTADPQ